MTECKDPKLLEHYLKKYKIRNFFDTQDLPFRLYRYEVGDIMNQEHPQELYIKFLVKGRIASDCVTENGEVRLFEETPFACWGYVEFCGRRFDNHYHKALETAYCVELATQPIREVLWNDRKFLQFLVKGMAESMYLATSTTAMMQEDIKMRLIHYLHSMPDRKISGVEQTARLLRCSRRQLYRAIGQLVEEGALRRTGWGEYMYTSS